MRAVLLLLFLVPSALVQGQGLVDTLITDTGLVVRHTHANGGPSTEEWTDLQGHYGRSTAYDREGNVIFQHSTRTIGGHCTVVFTYHANGTVSSAIVDDAPEAGPQWYRSTTTFQEDGTRKDFHEEGNDITPKGERLRLRTLDDTPLPPPDSTANGVPLFVNEVYVLNDGSVPCLITIAPRGEATALPPRKFTLQPGENARVGHFLSAGEFRSPVDVIVVTGTVTQRNGTPRTVGVLMNRKQTKATQQRAYYYQVAASGGSIGFGF